MQRDRAAGIGEAADAIDGNLGKKPRRRGRGVDDRQRAGPIIRGVFQTLAFFPFERAARRPRRGVLKLRRVSVRCGRVGRRAAGPVARRTRSPAGKRTRRPKRPDGQAAQAGQGHQFFSGDARGITPKRSGVGRGFCAAPSSSRLWLGAMRGGSCETGSGGRFNSGAAPYSVPRDAGGGTGAERLWATGGSADAGAGTGAGASPRRLSSARSASPPPMTA